MPCTQNLYCVDRHFLHACQCAKVVFKSDVTDGRFVKKNSLCTVFLRPTRRNELKDYVKRLHSISECSANLCFLHARALTLKLFVIYPNSHHKFMSGTLLHAQCVAVLHSHDKIKRPFFANTYGLCLPV